MAVLGSLSLGVYGQFAAVSGSGNFERLDKDSALLTPEEALRGEVLWQRFSEEGEWVDMEANMPGGILAFVPEETADYRLKISDGTCEPEFSEAVKVHSMNTTIREYLEFPVDPGDLIDAGVSVRQLYDNGAGVSELLGAGVDVDTLVNEGIPVILGDTGFVHIVYEDETWWMQNGQGEKFVPTGMNHVASSIRFADYNKEFWLNEFGENILQSNGYVNWQSPEVKNWMEQIDKDHKDYSFNTIAFHHPHWMPTEYFEELEIYYFGKPKLGEINHKYAYLYYDGFPDVFSQVWKEESDAYMQVYCAKHKDNKYFLGYTYNDLPDYGIHAIRMNRSGFFKHPWIMDIISKEGMTEGKKVWREVLKANYASPEEAGGMYGVELSAWEDIAGITKWEDPKIYADGIRDQDMMNKEITEAWLSTHYELIRKYDPDHLIYGDKIGWGYMGPGWGQPDWIWDVVRKYVDVILVQSYDFYTPQHEEHLRGVYESTGKPVINGDHGYGFIRPNMNDAKGIRVDSLEGMGLEYARYLKGVMNLPYMLGWQNCGYLETWSGNSDNTGKEQSGFFDPFGNPITEVLTHVKAANENAVSWHMHAGELSCLYSDKADLDHSDVKDCPCSQSLSYTDDWRGQANARIDSIRKNKLTVRVVDSLGNTIPGAAVHIDLQRHRFKFGAVVDNDFLVSPHTETYQEIFPKYFNGSGFNIALKQKHRDTPREDAAYPIMEWMLSHGIAMRGHALVWEGENYMRPEQVDILNSTTLSDSEKGDSLVGTAEIHFDHSIEKWDVFCWDVINEPITNHAINDLTEFNTFTYWFNLADSLRQINGREDMQLFLNEYQVISAIQNWALTRPQKYRDIIDQMLEEGAPIEGLGFQSRIKNGYLSPETMYQRLQDFEIYGLPYHATEFEIRETDGYKYSDALKKQILNELLTVYFSHPSVEGIWHWTFVDRPNGSSPWALFRYDGTPFPCGEEWIRMMEEDFNTDVTFVTDQSGAACVRGFKGDYEITVSAGGHQKTIQTSLDKDSSIEIVIRK